MWSDSVRIKKTASTDLIKVRFSLVFFLSLTILSFIHFNFGTLAHVCVCKRTKVNA